MPDFSHLGAKGEARMVDVGYKNPTRRTARAQCRIQMSLETFVLLQKGKAAKGDAFTVSKIAGILAAKKTADLIPLCHTLPIEHVSINFFELEDGSGFRICSEVATSAKTGVEMEALAAVSTAALTLYDMVKAREPGIVITEIRLLEKTGGKSDFAALQETSHLPSVSPIPC